MKNTKIRNQCADIIRYLRKCNKRRLSRSETETDIVSLCTDYRTLYDFVKEAEYAGVPSNEVFLKHSEELDYDDCIVSLITLYYYEKMGDSKYYDYLCDLILPSEYEMDEYKQYLMLKNKYEGEA